MFIFAFKIKFMEKKISISTFKAYFGNTNKKNQKRIKDKDLYFNSIEKADKMLKNKTIYQKALEKFAIEKK
jgi:hypothetical protein